MTSPSGRRSPSAGRGRPAAAEQESRNTRLLDAATATFLEEGFAGARMDEIARRAGASKHTLYARYPTKSKLFAALMERKSAQVFGAIGPLRPEQPVQAVLERFGTELLAMLHTREARGLHRLVIAECLEFPELGRTFWRLGPGRGYRMLAEYLREQQARGELICEDVDRAVEVWFGLLVGSISLRQNLRLPSFLHSRSEQEAWVRFVVKSFTDLFLKTQIQSGFGQPGSGASVCTSAAVEGE